MPRDLPDDGESFLSAREREDGEDDVPDGVCTEKRSGLDRNAAVIASERVSAADLDRGLGKATLTPAL